ncbi:MAG: dTMP kinase [Spirochaetales bacterium]
MHTDKREVLHGFFVLEGIDGAGTTTQLRRLEARAVETGLSLRADCEPTPYPAGVLIRQILRREVTAHPGTIARLFAADRQQHLEGLGGIREAVSGGIKVLSDRYFFSSLAYQSLECGWEAVAELNAGFPLPEALFFLDIEVMTAQHRINSRGQAREIYEDALVQEKVRQGYHRAIDEAQAQGLEVHRLDARLGVEELTDSIWARICR